MRLEPAMEVGGGDGMVQLAVVVIIIVVTICHYPWYISLYILTHVHGGNEIEHINKIHTDKLHPLVI